MLGARPVPAPRVEIKRNRTVERGAGEEERDGLSNQPAQDLGGPSLAKLGVMTPPAGHGSGIIGALTAALSFGVSVPLAKALLASVSPVFLAGLLYLGAGLFLTIVRLMRKQPIGGAGRGLRSERWIIAGAVVAGGLVAPPMLLWGLAKSEASETALLLNLEVVFTALLARAVFGERLGGTVSVAVIVMAFGGMSLSWNGASLSFSLPSLAVIGACALWALDNNLTRLISDIDAVFLGQVKGLSAGMVNICLALTIGAPLPEWRSALLGLGLGALSYGSSLVLFILAMRELGAARATAYFALAPFFGAAGGILFLGEHVSMPLLLAAGLLGLGTWLLVREGHSHAHGHQAAIHTHWHVHEDPRRHHGEGE